MPQPPDELPTPGHSTFGSSEALGSRAVLALCWRWIARAIAGYVGIFALLILGSLRVQPDQDWSADGGLATHVLTYFVLILFLSPVLAAIGAALAVAIWLALRFSRGSAKTGTITAGIGGTGLSMTFILVYSDPLLIDLLVYLGVSAVIGGIAAWMTVRDTSRIRSVTQWLARLQQNRAQGAA